MKEYFGNYLGLCINSDDPEKRGRVQVFIPHIMPALFENWNEVGADIQMLGVGDNIPNGLNAGMVEKLIKILPWAERAAPVIGQSSPGNLISPGASNNFVATFSPEGQLNVAATGGIPLNPALITVNDIVPGTHPDTGKGFTISGSTDANGRPAVFSENAAKTFSQMIKDSNGVVKTTDITSSQRDPDKNQSVGGAPGSKHLSGNAVDIHGSSNSWIRENGAKYGWFPNDYSGTHGGHFEFKGVITSSSGGATDNSSGIQNNENTTHHRTASPGNGVGPSVSIVPGEPGYGGPNPVVTVRSGDNVVPITDTSPPGSAAPSGPASITGEDPLGGHPDPHPAVAGINFNNMASGIFSYPNPGAMLWCFFREGNPRFPVYFAASYGQKEWQSVYRYEIDDQGNAVDVPGYAPTGNSPASTGGTMQLGVGALHWIDHRDDTDVTKDEQHIGLFHADGSHLNFGTGVDDLHSSFDFRQTIVGDEFRRTGGYKQETIYGDYNMYLPGGNLVITAGLHTPAAIQAAKNIDKIVDDAMKPIVEKKPKKTYGTTCQPPGGGGGSSTSGPSAPALQPPPTSLPANPITINPANNDTNPNYNQPKKYSTDEWDVRVQTFDTEILKWNQSHTANPNYVIPQKQQVIDGINKGIALLNGNDNNNVPDGRDPVPFVKYENENSNKIVNDK